MNELIIKNTEGTTLTATNWQAGFIAVDEPRHWEVGRSAEQLSKDFSNGKPSSGELSLKEMISFFCGSNNIEWDSAYIEHGSMFDKHPRPRMQDLAIWGKVDRQTFFVGVEAKVNEPFGSRSVAGQKSYIDRLKATGKNTEADARLKDLCNDFLSSVDKKDYGKLRYQLLYYLAGSFRENAAIIFMPVIVYHSDKFDASIGEKNFKSYEKFMELIGFERVLQHPKEMKAAYRKTIIAIDKSREHMLSKPVYSCYIEKHL